MKYLIALIYTVLLMVAPQDVSAQELVVDTVVTMKAQVLEVMAEREERIQGTDTNQLLQTVRLLVTEGPENGTEITIDNDYFELDVGDSVYINHTTNELGGTDYYMPVEMVRTPALLVLLGIFIAVVLLFGGMQGARGLLALAGSFFFIGALLIPGIMQGYSPILVSMGVASLIVIIGSYVTHGVNRTTSAAVVGMIVTIAITGFFAWGVIAYTDLSGWTDDEVTYLNLNTRGALDLAGLLLGGILIGLLGVLYDAAIGQAVSVEELLRAGKQYTRRDVYQRALRIGREHVGALVNTLAIAYAGASLPLLLLFFGSGPIDLELTLNRELFATEIVRILVGSIGLVLAVPITTAIAVSLLFGRNFEGSVPHAHAHALEDAQ